ncbi:MAG: hypothetical protein HY671_04805 [Chloroflexi bacterium]|nr:hypothetical protein [Chloroflexota bacterium]
MNAKFKRECGQVFTMALLTLAGGALIVGPLLGYVSATMTSIRKSAENTGRYYAADAATEHAIWLLRYGGLYLYTDEPYAYTYPAVNNSSVSVTIVNRSPVIDANCYNDQWPGTQTQKVEVGRVVSPSIAPPGVPTTFTVTVRLRNVGTATIHFWELGYAMPPFFTYVPGSSSGVTTNDPTITNGILTWGFTAPLPRINSGDTMTQTIQMVGTLPEGIYCDYCDVAWIIFGPDSTGCVLFRSGERFNVEATAGHTSIKSSILLSGTDVQVLSWETR